MEEQHIRIECPICGDDHDLRVIRVPTFEGMFEVEDGYSYGRYECPECGLDIKTRQYEEDTPEILILEDLRKELEILKDDIEGNPMNLTYRVLGVLLARKIKKDMGVNHVSIHDANDYLKNWNPRKSYICGYS